MKLPAGVSLLNVGRSDVAYLDKALLDERGVMKLFPALFYHSLPKDHLRAWASINARYGIPTVELVGFLRAVIGGRTALEIGAGHGDLGFHLGIPMIDSYQQVHNVMTAAYFAALGQTPTRPSSFVDKADAEAAVIDRKPRVVIASWVTEKFIGGDYGGNMHGPMEENIIANCETYIFIGNESVHGKKRVLSLPHAWGKPPWLVSRSNYPAENVIYIWDKNHATSTLPHNDS